LKFPPNKNDPSHRSWDKKYKIFPKA
jgi:hypothetical protein